MQAQVFEGDAFILVLDRSSSMNNLVGGVRLVDMLRSEAICVLAEISDRSDLGIVTFDQSVSVFNEVPLPASNENIEAAISWLLAMQVGSGSCLGGGTRRAIEIANMSTKARRSIMLFSDGEPSRCDGARHTTDQALQWIRAANTENLRINAIYVGTPTRVNGKNFLKRLAAETGGSYTEVVGAPRECLDQRRFIRGDTNADGMITISDVVTVVFQLAGFKTIQCADASDVGDNGTIELADAVLLMRYQFARGALPEPPFPGCDLDPTEDDRGCDSHAACD